MHHRIDAGGRRDTEPARPRCLPPAGHDGLDGRPLMATSGWAAARHELRLAGVLALIAGYVDAYGLIRYQTYLSFMSGNTTQTGSQIGQGHLAAAVPSYWRPKAPWWVDLDQQEHLARLPSPSPTAQPSSVFLQHQRHSPAGPSAVLTSTSAHACPGPQR